MDLSAGRFSFIFALFSFCFPSLSSENLKLLEQATCRLETTSEMRLLLLLVANFLIVLAYTTVTISETDFNSTKNLTAANAFYQDCLSAIQTLPTDLRGVQLPTRFSRNPDLRGYTLPKSARTGSCAVKVFFEDDASHDLSSWVDIKASLRQMVDLYRQGRLPAWTRKVGWFGYINLSLSPRPT